MDRLNDDKLSKDSLSDAVPQVQCFASRAMSSAIAAICLAGACLLAYVAARQAPTFWHTRHWIQTPATVTWLYQGTDSVFVDTDPPRAVDVPFCLISYTYSVRSQTYTNMVKERYRGDDKNMQCADFNAKLGPNNIHCFYNPDNHAESVFNLHFSAWPSLICIIVSFVLINLAAYCLSSLFTNKRRTGGWEFPVWWSPISACIAVVCSFYLIRISVARMDQKNRDTVLCLIAGVIFALMAVAIIAFFCYKSIVMLQSPIDSIQNNYSIPSIKNSIDIQVPPPAAEATDVP